MQTSLLGIANKAKQDKKYKFGNLYELINKRTLYEAWRRINKGAVAGVDKETIKEFKINLESNLDEMANELKNKKYKAKLVKRVYIPKGEKGTRPLGLPVLRDKIIQRAAASILEAIYEQDFIEDSYGYRPGKNAHMAINAIKEEISGKYNYVVEADIKGFFNNIIHDWMIRMLEERIKDRSFIGLIRKWLKAGILEPAGKVANPDKGCPQGSVISPILANIYLHYVIDLWYMKKVKPYGGKEAYYCRSADDFIFGFRYKEDAEKLLNALGTRLGKFGLELAEEKTGMVFFSRFKKNLGNKFSFLGFDFRWKESRNKKDYIVMETNPKRMTKSLKAFSFWCKENRNNRIRKIVDMVNRKLRGYFNYYAIEGNSIKINKFYSIATGILYKWLNRRSQRKSFNFKEFNKKMKYYGLIKPRILKSLYKQMSIEDYSFV
ncbi:UNVERIFIED_CONTAM: group II intron reverse transcriptase/maturase [Acetivibrio alkalicellulosi]